MRLRWDEMGGKGIYHLSRLMESILACKGGALVGGELDE